MMLTPKQRRELERINNRKRMSNKKHYDINERVVCLHSGKHGWVASTGTDKYGGTVYHIQYDRMSKDGVVGAPDMPWSLLRPETFMEYLFARKWSFGKWTAWQAVVIYGFLGIVAYGGVRTITYFGQPVIGWGLIVFVVVMVAGSISLHWENFKGRQA